MTILALLNEWMGLPELASEHGSMVDHMLEMVHWLMGALLVGWSAFFVYALIRFRRKKNPKADYYGVRGHASTHLEVGVVLAEAILLLGFAFPLWAARNADYPTGPDVVRVRAVGEQFTWNFHYPGDDGKFGLTNPFLIKGDNPLGRDMEDPNGEDDFISKELVLPKGRECIVTVTSKDVIHNLHLVPMRIAQDAIPGTVIDMWFRPTKTGRWQAICGQLCGSNHAAMVSWLEVMTAADYDTWHKENAPAVPAPEDNTAASVGSAPAGSAPAGSAPAGGQAS